VSNQKEIGGNTAGIRKTSLDVLTALYDIRSEGYVDPEILRTVCALSARYAREICLSVSRNGTLLAITLGTGDRVSVQGAGGSRKERGKLSGVRTLHTHPGGGAALSEMDRSVMRANHDDCMAVIAIDGDGRQTGSLLAYIAPDGIHEFCEDPNGPAALPRVSEYEKQWKAAYDGLYGNDTARERVVLCGISAGEGSADAEESMSELAELARTAGAEVIATVLQGKTTPDPRTFLGKGKVTEIAELVQINRLDAVFVDNDLSGVQQKNLEDAFGVKVVDRGMLILDIFAGRATSQEGKLQVELAQLKYTLPRLLGAGGRKDKLRAGIGMRGPGEKKLETDRRRIRQSVDDLEARLEKLKQERDLRRNRRVTHEKTVAIIGYTNAGKSTLMNLLAKSDVLAENKLFATLDPVTRKVFVDEKRHFLLTDTVGFIRRLPHEFVEAFQSTLEEARYADLLVHVMDASNPSLCKHYEVVQEVLQKLGASDKPVLNVYNKMDRVTDAPVLPVTVGAVKISCATGQGVETLKQRIIGRLYQ
jgi:GTP-binding protein HflX